MRSWSDFLQTSTSSRSSRSSSAHRQTMSSRPSALRTYVPSHLCLKSVLVCLGSLTFPALSHPLEQTLRFVQSLPKRERIPLSKKFPKASPAAVDLLEKMLVFDPRTRITAAEALAHPFLEPYHDPVRFCRPTFLPSRDNHRLRATPLTRCPWVFLAFCRRTSLLRRRSLTGASTTPTCR